MKMGLKNFEEPKIILWQKNIYFCMLYCDKIVYICYSI